MNPWKGLICDFGGVLSLTQKPETRKTLADLGGVSLDAFESRYFGRRLEYDADILSDAEYWATLLDRPASAIPSDLLRRLVEIDIAGWFTPNTPMLQWLSSVRPRFQRMVLLSNMPFSGLDYLNRNCRDWFTMFDDFVYSCNIRAVKPEPAAFLKAVETAGLPAGSILLVDDLVMNIEAARKFGLQAILYKDHEGFEEEMERAFGGE